jgi:hypothetical protein
MNRSALAQLDIIREISDALTCAGVDHWLLGGWAVDFAVGDMTRQQDIKVVATRRASRAERMISVRPACRGAFGEYRRIRRC